jgi:hypothetical protein
MDKIDESLQQDNLSKYGKLDELVQKYKIKVEMLKTRLRQQQELHKTATGKLDKAMELKGKIRENWQLLAPVVPHMYNVANENGSTVGMENPVNARQVAVIKRQLDDQSAAVEAAQYDVEMARRNVEATKQNLSKAETELSNTTQTRDGLVPNCTFCVGCGTILKHPIDSKTVKSHMKICNGIPPDKKELPVEYLHDWHFLRHKVTASSAWSRTEKR